ncbi:gamma-glutamylcyclotransferase [Sulfolobus sp. S-194]|uniref:gamma-glutamylcyclotransferase n=1 Tax=Sulfolobus sp. S-194 TaxID=2512240 RepID=UPI001436E3EF|nr:gamma-glutamylcyclotransferase [Sulfolobus sp. S-194]QIW24991.1 gamma-glutamylcyclotransferase [Sulfolobus sp. S-194]
MPYLFVYGSLRYGFELHHLLENSRFVGLAYTEGYKMYDLGSYPGVVKGDGIIYGEVYEVDDNTILLLDKVEDYRGRPDDLYIREKTKVYFDDKRRYSLSDVYIYIYNQDISGRDLIEEGDYSKYVRMPVILNYFAYAENTNEEILKQRGVKKILKKINAIASGYRMIFNIPCRWGYCANLIEDKEGKICGYIYIMIEDELNALDKAEQHLVKYMRDVIKVVDENGKEYYAYAYVSPDKENPKEPSKEYLNLILQGLNTGWGNRCMSIGLL